MKFQPVIILWEFGQLWRLNLVLWFSSKCWEFYVWFNVGTFLYRICLGSSLFEIMLEFNVWSNVEFSVLDISWNSLFERMLECYVWNNVSHKPTCESTRMTLCSWILKSFYGEDIHKGCKSVFCLQWVITVCGVEIHM